jgi:hypothetical protein
MRDPGSSYGWSQIDCVTFKIHGQCMYASTLDDL